ncbi:TetR/AcrR family transcriptional regulator [Sphingomonas bacterium]|uniref:TetR/AcrR family transcriptional regulator n=1 Tax=Sphingomonas bacterium TaxID=1895847 RepID=UPI001575BDF4|nr:TetR/AcrR family transcriptional regulator [Sphingomonas bacterium]
MATRHFVEQGFERTSMSAIAKEMGGSKGTLWSYFASKEELFAAALEEGTQVFRASMTEILSPEHNLPEAIRAFAERFIQRLTADDAVAIQRAILGEVSRSPDLGRIYMERAPNMAHAALSDYLKQQIASGAIRPSDPDEAARTLLSLCTGGHTQRVLWGVAQKDHEAARKQAALAAEHFCRLYIEP